MWGMQKVGNKEPAETNDAVVCVADDESGDDSLSFVRQHVN